MGTVAKLRLARSDASVDTDKFFRNFVDLLIKASWTGKHKTQIVGPGVEFSAFGGVRSESPAEALLDEIMARSKGAFCRCTSRTPLCFISCPVEFIHLLILNL